MGTRAVLGATLARHRRALREIVSSLSYLERLPIDVLKIDRSFIAGIDDEDDRNLVPAILEWPGRSSSPRWPRAWRRMNKGMRLCALGCEPAQGCYFSRPVPAATFAEMLELPPDTISRWAGKVASRRRASPTPAATASRP